MPTHVRVAQGACLFGGYHGRSSPRKTTLDNVEATADRRGGSGGRCMPTVYLGRA